jgi:hypothetical protein
MENQKNRFQYAALAISLLSPLFVAAGWLGYIRQLPSDIARIETSVSELREVDQRLSNFQAADYNAGTERAVKIRAMEERLNACCPYYRNVR